MGDRVYNKHFGDAPADAVYIGRGSPWGNPFVIGRDGDRDEVCDRFEREVLPTLDLEPLRGKDLVCFCAPQRCHGDSIVRALAQTPEITLSESELDPKALEAAVHAITPWLNWGPSAPETIAGNAIRAYLTSRSPAQPEGVTDAWQDISTAPKDGEPFMAVGVGADGRPMHAIVTWGCVTHLFSSAHQCTRHPSPDCVFDWLGMLGSRFGVPFTYWQPLTSPAALRSKP